MTKRPMEGSAVHLAGDGSAWRRARAGECVVTYEIGAEQAING